jgi:succinate dehydrogenase/fumarate reductase flavoprotein subunit
MKKQREIENARSDRNMAVQEKYQKMAEQKMMQEIKEQKRQQAMERLVSRASAMVSELMRTNKATDGKPFEGAAMKRAFSEATPEDQSLIGPLFQQAQMGGNTPSIRPMAADEYFNIYGGGRPRP